MDTYTKLDKLGEVRKDQLKPWNTFLLPWASSVLEKQKVGIECQQDFLASRSALSNLSAFSLLSLRILTKSLKTKTSFSYSS